MNRIHETFMARESRVQRTLVAIDLTNSTALKEQRDEATWLPSYGWFYQDLINAMEAHKGTIVKYLGDGVMAAFGDDDVHDAINWGIQIQEQMARARDDKRISLTCSVGIATGEVVEFLDPQGKKDYIGTTVDRAFRLCAAANANAVFVDEETVAAAAMNKIKSEYGSHSVPRRTSSSYQGSRELWKAKGFAQPIPYYEILWAENRFSVRAETVSSEIANSTSEQPIVATVRRPASVDVATWLEGEVISYFDDRTFGFIKSEGVDYYFNPGLLLRREHMPTVGSRVLFVPASPTGNATNRRASNVVPKGAPIRSKLSAVHANGFGFAPVVNMSGESFSIFINLIDSSRWQVGDEVQFNVGKNARGIAGFDAQKAPTSDE